MCVGEKTYRLANVDFGRYADKICAAASRSLLVGKVVDFVDDLRRRVVYPAAHFSANDGIFPDDGEGPLLAPHGGDDAPDGVDQHDEAE